MRPLGRQGDPAAAARRGARREQDVAGFNKDYLYLGGAPAEVARYFDRLEKDQATR